MIDKNMLFKVVIGFLAIVGAIVIFNYFFPAGHSHKGNSEYTVPEHQW